MPARQSVSSVLSKMIERVNSNIRRLRVVEQDSSVLKERVTALEEEILSLKREIDASARDHTLKRATLEERIVKIEHTLKEVIAQLKKTSTTTKIKELEDLIDMYNPLKSQFITRDEVAQLLEKKGH